ncbi:agouti-related protein [Choloepus didactylus]|uniref:agouti-related protein n=1 Tax=Choloepus didactylus TaxID=27675 RepID=UPI0001FA0BFB|nr:agouti-related protein [Choloepus didactylus]XP_037671541.1 agouti-related protein [Choloepus didactylus]XP_037671542.1 agouti-related protein [Choloepus didactylus]XP_037671543.1 agouti-related protein [Choloepus didactylus]
MLTAVLLSSVALLLAPPTMEGAQMGVAPLEGIRRPDQALFPEFSDLDLQPQMKRTGADQAEETLLQEAQALAEALDPQGREPRSPRRCVRLHESCLGQQVQCCDPCATCYCRFFNAFCYCRKLGTGTHPCSRN